TLYIVSPSFSFSTPRDHAVPPASPTRRSSDLPVHRHRLRPRREEADRGEVVAALPCVLFQGGEARDLCRCARLGHSRPRQPAVRSEEHTSELQSRENLVCRLLLEKTNYRSTLL